MSVMDLFMLVSFCIIQQISSQAFEDDYDDAKPQLNKKRYNAEVEAGSVADMMENKHVFHTHKYKDLGRRFALTYPFKDIPTVIDGGAVADFHDNVQVSQKVAKGEDPKLIPMKASPELVLAVAKKSAELDAAHPDDEAERASILRSGDYWNGVWKEDVDPTLLRTNDIAETERAPEKLESIQAKIMPGSKLYHLVSLLQKMSPKLLYIINKAN